MDADRVRVVFWVSFAVIGALAFWFYASAPAVDGGRTRWRQWAAWGVPLAAALFRQFFHFRWHGVKPFEDDAPPADHDMSTPALRTNADEDGRTDGRPVSAADAWLDRFEVDRTKTAAIELMVYSGWSVAQIRAVVKGENAALGAEIDAARQRLGIEPEPPRAIPLRPRSGEERVLILDDNLGISKP